MRLCLHYTEPLFVSTGKTLRHSMNRNGPELKQVVHTGYSWKCVAISLTFSIVYGCLIYCGPSSLLRSRLSGCHATLPRKFFFGGALRDNPKDGCEGDYGPSSLEIAVVTRLTTFKTVDLPMPKALATFLTRRSSVR